MDLRSKLTLVNTRIDDEIKRQLLEMPELASLRLANVAFESLAFLSEAKKLVELEIDFNGLDYGAHATGINELRQLKVIKADDNNVTLADLSVLKPLRELEELHFAISFGGYGDWTVCTKIRDVKPLKHLPKLHTLKLRFGGDCLDGFTELKQLRCLSLCLSKGSLSLSPLGELVQLEELELSSESSGWGLNPIGSIAPLAKLTNLTSLIVKGIKLRTIEPIKNIKHLKRLDCSRNSIRSLKPLLKLVELRELKIENNPIKDYSPIQGLPNYDSSWIGE